jgi:hypothetical protein
MTAAPKGARVNLPRRVRFATGVVALAGIGLLGASPADGETYKASNTEQFAAAVAEANANKGANTIVLAGRIYLPQATLTLTNTTGPLTIEGPTTPPTAKIEGSAVESYPSPLIVIDSGVGLALKNVEEATGGGPGSPAIEDFGNLTIESSTIAGNNGTSVLVEPGATATLRNTTLADSLGAGMVDNGTARLFSSTVAFNDSGGIFDDGSLSLTNTIVADNRYGDCPEGTGRPRLWGEPVPSVSDHSLDSDGSCNVGSLSGKDPLLQKGLLLDGGLTPLHSLRPGSPAIDAGDPAACPASDQRGQTRPDVPSTPCDIGADEYNQTPPTITVPADITTPATGPQGAYVGFAVAASSADDVVHRIACMGQVIPGWLVEFGSMFPIGTTNVTCTATDGHETTASASFKITVTGSNGPAALDGTPARAPTLLAASSRPRSPLLAAPSAPMVSTAELDALLARQLRACAKAARIGALLKGGVAVRLRALGPGTATIAWYYLPPGAGVARRAGPVLVASGRLKFSAAGAAPITVKPTAEGRRLLRHVGRLKLTARGTFTPTGRQPVTATRTFVLKR